MNPESICLTFGVSLWNFVLEFSRKLLRVTCQVILKDMLRNSMVLTEQAYLFGANGIGCMVKMVSNVIPIPSQLNKICIFDGVRRDILNWTLCYFQVVKIAREQGYEYLDVFKTRCRQSWNSCRDWKLRMLC